MQYRLAQRSDFRQLARLYWACSTEENDLPEQGEEAFSGRWNAFLEDHIGTDYVCWVAEEAGEIVSHVYIGILEKMPVPREQPAWIGYVANVFTLPSFRNRGIAAELMDTAQDWARTHAFEALFVLPGVKSVSFFERQAFTEDNKLMEYAFRKN